MDWFSTQFQQFRQNFGFADALDILLVSILLYSLLAWFKATASRRVLIGMFVLAAVYIFARAFDMYLTSMVFQAGLAVLVVVVVVVFQEDLRRMLERVTTWRWLRPFSNAPSGDSDEDALVETVFAMAAQRVGALIVIRGTEPVERHVDGGIPLRGMLSRPLLLSIFDEHSPGHDGALFIENGRIESFALHLPISKNQAEIAGRGTRHSAALGLSECCDALVIVVSEERGSVSVAEAGHMIELRSAAALKGRIQRFNDEKHPRAQESTPWSQLVARNMPLKAAAFALAVVAWFGLAYNPDTLQLNFVVPIQYRNLPQTLVLGADAPRETELTLFGSEREFQFLNPDMLRVSIDLREAKAGFKEIDLMNEGIRIPANLTLYHVNPRTIELSITSLEPAEPDSAIKTSRN